MLDFALSVLKGEGSPLVREPLSDKRTHGWERPYLGWSGGERCGVEQSGKQQRHEDGGHQEAQRRGCGEQLADRKNGAKRLGEIGRASNQRTSNEPDRCPDAEQ